MNLLTITSDGTPHGTLVLCDGEPVEGVYRVQWSIKVDGPATAVIHAHVGTVELKGTGRVETTRRKRWRDAITGQFIRRRKAEQNPDTTVSEQR